MVVALGVRFAAVCPVYPHRFGGQVLGVTARGASLREAVEKSYAAAKPISFQDMHYRTDL